MANGNEEIGCEVKITQAGGTEIYLDSKAIKTVEFLVDTIDENVKDRSEDIVNKVTITGTVTPESKETTKNLALWSLATKSEEVYRSAEITIRILEDQRIRKYTMSKVFCLDYKETFQNGQKDHTYVLKFAQRKDDLSGITVIS